MADILSAYALTNRYPHPLIRSRSYNTNDNLTFQRNDELKDGLQRAMSRVRGDDDASLLVSDGTTGSTITIYRIDYTAGSVLVAGLPGIVAAGTDVILVGAGNWTKSYQLDGTAAVVLTADGQTYDMALVAIVVDGAVELHAVFGDEAADTAEVAPTDTEISAALILAGITNLETRAGVIIGRAKIQQAASAITLTGIDPAANLGQMAERSTGGLFGTEV